MSEGEEVETEPSHSFCPAYDELLEVMERATARLDLPWKRAKLVAPRSRFDERRCSMSVSMSSALIFPSLIPLQPPPALDIAVSMLDL